MANAGMRSPLLLIVIGVVVAIVIASTLYWFTQNPTEQYTTVLVTTM